MAKKTKTEAKQEVEKIQNGLYLVKNSEKMLLVTNLGMVIKETTEDEVEGLRALHPKTWDRQQIAAMVAIDNMVKQEARK